MERGLTVYSKERGLRSLKPGVTLSDYREKYPSAIRCSVPSMESLMDLSDDGSCECPDGCIVEPDGICEHGFKSWLLIMGAI